MVPPSSLCCGPWQTVGEDIDAYQNFRTIWGSFLSCLVRSGIAGPCRAPLCPPRALADRTPSPEGWSRGRSFPKDHPHGCATL